MFSLITVDDAAALNVYVCAITIVGLSIGMLILLLTKVSMDISSRSAMAMAAWLGSWCTLLILHSALRDAPPRLDLILIGDALTSTSVLACALFLLAPETWPPIKIASCCVCAFTLITAWAILWGQSNSQDLAVRALAALPGGVISMASFVCLAYGVSTKVAGSHWLIWPCGIGYALLQIPAYMDLVIAVHPSHPIRYRLLLAAGKFALLVATAAVILKQLNTSKRSIGFKTFIRTISWLTTLIGFATAMYTFFNSVWVKLR